MVGRKAGWLDGWQGGGLADGQSGWQAVWQADRPAGGMAVWPAGRLAGGLAVWLSGRLACRQADGDVTWKVILAGVWWFGHT